MFFYKFEFTKKNEADAMIYTICRASVFVGSVWMDVCGIFESDSATTFGKPTDLQVRNVRTMRHGEWLRELHDLQWHD